MTSYPSLRHPDLPPNHDLDTAKIQRPGRPSLQQRQSSFNKRHASFDTPREVPFSAQPVSSSDVRGRRESISRNNSESSVATSRPRSPSSDPQDVVHSLHAQGYEPLCSTVQARGEGSNTTGVNHISTPRGGMDVDSASSSEPMTYKYESESAGGSSFSRTIAEAHRDHRNAGLWDSSNLRPELLASPPKPRPRDIPSQQNHHTSMPGPCSPYYLANQEGCEIYAPTPTRPSSAASLPLPSQMPFYALPASGSIQQRSESHSGLPSVIEQEQMNFDSPFETASMTSSGSDPRSWQRRPTPPPLNSLTALLDAADRFGRRNPRVSAAESTSTVSTALSASSQLSSASSSLPPPTPPTVHTPPPPPADGIDDEKSDSSEGKRRSAPYEPFLSHAPPPKDTYITVETTDVEYRLIVRLPGYRRDAMFVLITFLFPLISYNAKFSMLSTRRRRILHIAADSWEAGGGMYLSLYSFTSETHFW